MGRASLNLKFEPKVRLFVKMKLNDIPGKYLFDKETRYFFIYNYNFIYVQFKFITRQYGLRAVNTIQNLSCTRIR